MRTARAARARRQAPAAHAARHSTRYHASRRCERRPTATSHSTAHHARRRCWQRFLCWRSVSLRLWRHVLPTARPKHLLVVHMPHCRLATRAVTIQACVVFRPIHGALDELAACVLLLHTPDVERVEAHLRVHLKEALRVRERGARWQASQKPHDELVRPPRRSECVRAGQADAVDRGACVRCSARREACCAGRRLGGSLRRLREDHLGRHPLRARHIHPPANKR